MGIAPITTTTTIATTTIAVETTTPDWKFNCTDGNWIHVNWVCDGNPDCEDNSDEINCNYDDQGLLDTATLSKATTIPTTTTTITTTRRTTSSTTTLAETTTTSDYKFYCTNGDWTNKRFVC